MPDIEKDNENYKPRLLSGLSKLLDPFYFRMEKLDSVLSSHGLKPKYSRNDDLKKNIQAF